MNLPLLRPNRVRLTGTTAHARTELGGVVLEDRIRPFTASASLGPVSGTLQDRVVRSTRDGTLAFYYRIGELRGGNLDQALVLNYGFIYGHVPSALDVDFRLDGLGEVGPYAAFWNGSSLYFEFSGVPGIPPVTPTALSRFMFVLVPRVTEYQTGGIATISAMGWSVDLRDCFRPVIPEAARP